MDGQLSRMRTDDDVRLVQDIAIDLPPSLSRFADHALASVTGTGPLIIMLGGISADRYPCRRCDGAAGWWHELARSGGAIDPNDYRIASFEFIADETGKVAPSPGDQATVIAALLDALGERRAHAIVGASYGAMVALDFAQHFAARVERIVIISAGAGPHPASSAMRELQRRVVALALEAGRDEAGLAIARGMAMLTYRTREEFADRFTGGILDDDTLARSDAGTYLGARGEAYRSVMSARRFLSLSASIDRHRSDPSQITVPALLIGAESDQLVPPVQMRELDQRLAGPSTLHLRPSYFGHDMFLKDAAEIAGLVGAFLREGE